MDLPHKIPLAHGTNSSEEFKLAKYCGENDATCKSEWKFAVADASAKSDHCFRTGHSRIRMRTETGPLQSQKTHLQTLCASVWQLCAPLHQRPLHCPASCTAKLRPGSAWMPRHQKLLPGASLVRSFSGSLGGEARSEAAAQAPKVETFRWHLGSRRAIGEALHWLPVQFIWCAVCEQVGPQPAESPSSSNKLAQLCSGRPQSGWFKPIHSLCCQRNGPCFSLLAIA